MFKVRGVGEYSSIEQNVYTYGEAKERMLQYIDMECSRVVITQFNLLDGSVGKVMDYYDASQWEKLCQQ